jgi:hypothetical protein
VTITPLGSERHPQGEHLDVPERLIVALANGILRFALPDAMANGSGMVRAGQNIASIESNVDVTVVRPYTALWMGMLALPGHGCTSAKPSPGFDSSNELRAPAAWSADPCHTDAPNAD